MFFSVLRSLSFCGLLALVSLRSPAVFAQQKGETISGSPAFAWRAELPGGTYMVSLAALRHISVHEYLVPGVGKITEMTVDAGGSVSSRFYAVGLPDAQTPSNLGQTMVDRAKEALNEARDRMDASGITRSVVKDYPSTTHAHTVEYFISSPESVRKLYQNLERAWMSGRGDSIKIE